VPSATTPLKRQLQTSASKPFSARKGENTARNSLLYSSALMFQLSAMLLCMHHR
jgi:hypothetical protein